MNEEELAVYRTLEKAVLALAKKAVSAEPSAAALYSQAAKDLAEACAWVQAPSQSH